MIKSGTCYGTNLFICFILLGFIFIYFEVKQLALYFVLSLFKVSILNDQFLQDTFELNLKHLTSLFTFHLSLWLFHLIISIIYSFHFHKGMNFCWVKKIISITLYWVFWVLKSRILFVRGFVRFLFQAIVFSIVDLNLSECCSPIITILIVRIYFQSKAELNHLH